MATIIETLVGRQETTGKQEYFNLIASGKTKTKTSSEEKRNVDRVPQDELERCFNADSFIFNAVTVAVEMIMSAEHKITAKKLHVRKYFEDFFNNISKVGADSTFDEILTRIFQDAYVYHGAWNEIVWNELDTEPVDIKTLNPIGMDFARDSKNQVVLDKNEKPIGYTQELPYGTNTKGKGDTLPEGVSVKTNQIFIDAKRISYIPLYTYGSGFLGMGRVEPAYKATIWKLNLLKAGAESTSRRGFSPVIAKVGNEKVHPTPQMITNILENLKKLDYSKYLSMPWYVELTTLDVKSIETYEDFLKYLTAMQSAALGVPVPFVTGLGEETNRATLGTQLEVFQLQLNAIAQKVCRRIEKYIFRPIAEAQDFEEVPKLEWGEVTTFSNMRKALDTGTKQDQKDQNIDNQDKGNFPKVQESKKQKPKI